MRRWPLLWEDNQRKQRREHKASELSVSSAMSLQIPSFLLQKRLLFIDFGNKGTGSEIGWTKTAGPAVCEKIWRLEVDYRTNRLTNCLPRYDDTVTSYATKWVKRIKSLMKAHFFSPNDPLAIIGLLATVMFACDANRVPDRAAVGTASLCQRNNC